ncbi:MAG: DUF3570 domain-containing protein [Chromatiales bacterium]
MRLRLLLGLLSLGLVCGLPSGAAVLPEDRADALYHRYNGGGVTVDGPSYLVRKGIGQSVSVFGNYYLDSVSSASVDVVTQGSPYSEQRTEYSLGADYLVGKNILSVSYTNSDESDYKADTVSFGVSMDMFGDLTTVNMGFSRGWDDVGRNVAGIGTEDVGEVDRRSYRVGLTQVLTKDAIMSLNYELVTDEGFLNNPYRNYRYCSDPDPTPICTQASFAPEKYPNTRTSNAAALRASYFLPYRASIRGYYRFFTDTWDINAHTFELGYTQPLFGRWTLDAKARYYTQNSAEFYSDLFPFQDSQNFMARDKELSEFNSYTVGAGITYEFLQNTWGFIDKGTLNFFYDYIYFDYKDFRDNRDTSIPPELQPEYDFDAGVIQAYLSLWY